MGWFVLPSLWSGEEDSPDTGDGMSQADFSDLDAAYSSVEDLIMVTGTERFWSNEELELAFDDLDAAYSDANSWWNDDVGAFYGTLYASSSDWTGTGADKLQAVFASGGNTSADVVAAKEAASVTTILTGTATGTAKDIGAAATVAGGAVKAATGSSFTGPIILAALVVVGLVAVRR